MASPAVHASLNPADLAWLKRVARALLRSEGDADDLVQDTVVAALQAGPADVTSSRSWLRSVAGKLAARRHRDAIRRGDRERSRATEGSAPSSHELVAAAEAAEHVAGAARRLQEPFRRAVLEHYLEELSVAEIAARSGAKVDTVRWRLRRGLELLREDLARENAGDAENSSWALALLPLALLPEKALPVPTALSISFPATVSSLVLTMKPLLAVAAALLCAIGFFVIRPESRFESPNEVSAVRRESEAHLEPQKTRPQGAPQALARVELRPDVSANTAASGDRAAGDVTRLQGRVVGERQSGIEGAVVFLMDPHPDEADRALLPPRTTTGRDGAFTLESRDVERWLSRHDGEVRVAAVANGYLRSEGLPIARGPAGSSARELVISLDAGLSIDGRVEGPLGQPVTELALFIHSPFVNSDSLCATRVLMEGSKRQLSPPEGWPYSQCEGRTSANGSVSFGGLEPGSYTVRSLDPGWEITGPEWAEAGSGGLVWQAERRFGVRLVATRGGVPVRADEPRIQLDAPKMTAKFELTLWTADGRRIATGRWFGSGNGEVSFTLTPDLVPGVELHEIDAVRFHGDATLAGETVEWISPMLRRADLDSEVDRVPVEFTEKPSEEALSSELADDDAIPARTARVELDVRYLESGAPFVDDLSIEWTRVPEPDEEGETLTGGVRGERLGSGRYGIRVPAGAVVFEVQAANASGSLPAWRGRASCSATGTTVVPVELREGATALVQRPPGWKGEWFVRASYRVAPEDDWFGSWNYSTAGDELRLDSLKPAEWRFELRERRAGSEAPEVRTLTLVPGDVLEVR
ncbi:RNA polymerase sigma factor [Planctomycetes bacterium Poly30]|uniref:RNA polymerase sigma factor n=1 Tax=Saltatorellus ferox TaxID=2528018 RepID=A0A518EL72_9BACT|nr:RNA polymerase sigma factor [Planctomycetes bacterium Poly30]